MKTEAIIHGSYDRSSGNGSGRNVHEEEV
jgi:hypothetical protein